MKQHFVTFYSPGTFLAEDTTKSIDSWDVDKAKKMAAGIKERYGATPYAFQFSTRTREAKDLDSKVSATSPTYFMNVEVRTLEQVKKEAKPDEKILLSNMECNGWKAIVTTTKGWKWSQPLRKGDVVL